MKNLYLIPALLVLSLTGFVFFERLNSPSSPANALEIIKKNTIENLKIFFIIKIDYIIHNVIM